jgi:hypothetical protein
MPKKPCRQPGCPNLIPIPVDSNKGSAYCADHQNLVESRHYRPPGKRRNKMIRALTPEDPR